MRMWLMDQEEQEFMILKNWMKSLNVVSKQSVLWDEVKDRLDSLGTKLSGGQQTKTYFG